MKIAQIAPLYESVPPPLYGGTERVVSYLTEELVRQGHDVTLFASGDSSTSARLIAPCERALRLDDRCVDPGAHHVLLLEMVRRRADRFDILHYHLDYLHFPLSRCRGRPHVTTLHGRLDLPDLPPLFREFKDMPVVSISRAQRMPLPWIGWAGNVPHGLPPDLFSFHAGGDYLAWLGRFSPEKRPDRAIEIAERAGMPLKMAGKVDRVDRKYFEQEIEPLLEKSHVEHVGEIGGREKEEFLGGAHAVLFSVDWPEPFGLVMIEAMACGTPLVAFRCGSIPEVMVPGKTGYVVDSVDEAVRAVERIGALSREECRRVFEERYTVERMAREYVSIYRRVIGEMARPGERGRRRGRTSAGRGPTAWTSERRPR